MYFPYLRGKKYELYAIKELSSLIKMNGKIIPIIVPVNANTTTTRVIERLDTQCIPFMIMINPMEGELAKKRKDIEEKLISIINNSETSRLVFCIDRNSTLSEVEECILKYKNFKLSFFHMDNTSIGNDLIKLEAINNNIEYHLFVNEKTSEDYRLKFSQGKRVLIQDGFKAQVRNADFPLEEVFSELLFKYSEKYIGFGDYLIVGKNMPNGGGPAHAVALHYTYHSINDNSIMIRHFVSDDTEGAINVSGKYFQSIDKLCDFITTLNAQPFTLGENGYFENKIDRLYHNLGHPKKLSMLHHIEMTSKYL